MKVCLIRPPTITTAEAVGEDAAPPLGVAYLAGSLLAAGHDVTIIDALGEALSRYDRIDYLPTGLRHGLADDEILSRIPQDVEVIGISIMFSLEWPFTRDLTTMIRKAFPDAFLVAGGEHITALPEFSLSECPAINACALGEGEQIIVIWSRRCRTAARWRRSTAFACARTAAWFAPARRSGSARSTPCPVLPGSGCLSRNILARDL